MTVVTTYQNVLTKEEWNTVRNTYLKRPQWKFGHTSTHQISQASVYPRPKYWKMKLHEDEFFMSYMSEIILNLVPVNNLKVRNVYAGGNTFGTSGDIHTDSERDDFYTFLYHASPCDWRPMYGGKTSFYPVNAPPEYYEFTPNGGLFFHSNVPHLGEPVTRYFDGLRICIAFKLIPHDQ